MYQHGQRNGKRQTVGKKLLRLKDSWQKILRLKDSGQKILRLKDSGQKIV